jgi:tRNA dimethylallyltransferase
VSAQAGGSHATALAADAGQPITILLMGPTGAGKTELKLRARGASAARSRERGFGDDLSRHGYRYPRSLGRRTRARTPHRLIDILDPAQSYSAGVSDAMPCASWATSSGAPRG